MKLYQGNGSVVNIGSAGPGNEQVKLKYLHWNIGHFAVGNNTSSTITQSNYEEKKKAFIKMFEHFNADIVGLCEWSSVFYDGLYADNEILSMYKYHNTAPTEKQYQGLSIHSRETIKLKNFVEFDLGNNQNKAYECILTLAGEDIYVCECHLPWESQSANDTALNILMNRYSDKDKVIIAGDFNFFKGDSTHIPYTESYARVKALGYESANCGKWGNLLTSYNNVICTNYLDSIFVKGGQILHTEVVQKTPTGKDADNPSTSDELLWDNVNLSDHFPICCEIMF